MTGLIAILTDSEKAKAYEKSLTVQKIVNQCMPISEVCRYSGMAEIKKAVDIQLTKLVAGLNLKWNLSDNQIAQIVEDLIEKYPHETLEDFVLVLKKARMGEFGELFRLDGPVIFSWMETYLEEKYAVIENKLHSERDDIFKVKPIKSEDDGIDWLKRWSESVEQVNVKPIAPMSEKEIRKEGQIRPIAKEYVAPSVEELNARKRHFQYILENYDARTGDPLENWMPENQWNELNS